MKRILLVGPGLIGRRHLELIEQSPDALLAGIVAPDNAENRAVAHQYKTLLFETMEEGIAIKPDGIIIASPNEFHFEQARSCILAGIPVLVEKPITVSIKDAFELHKLSKDLKTPVLVGHHRNYSSILKKAKEVIEDGLIGEIVSIIGSAQFFKPSHYFQEGPWRTKLGGGPILINMIHEISNLRFLCGEIEKVHAFASQKIRNFEVEDTASINIFFENGTLGTFVVSDTAASAMSWENTSGENKSYPQYKDDNCYFISGTKGSLQVPTMIYHSFTSDIERSWWNKMEIRQFSYPVEDPLVNQFEHFINVVSEIAKPTVSSHDGLSNLRVIAAIRKSIEDDRTISIDSISS